MMTNQTKEDYYAQIEDIYAQVYGESHAPRLSYRSRKGKKENLEDQALNDEELVETEVATELIGIEDGTVKREANAEVISAMVKEEPIPQFQAIIQASHVKEMEEFPHQSTNGSGKKIAHQLFDQMPSKEKQRKCLKAWKFKFKPASKRSKSMDDMFSFVEETALLKKDPKEAIWDCVKKEFKETMAACGKNRVDRIKLAEEKESRLQVLDLNQTFMYHQIGHGVDILLALKIVVHDKEMAVVLQRATSLTIRDCPDSSSRANRVWKPGGLLCVQDHSGGSILMITQQFHGLRLQRIIYMDMKFQEVIVDNVEAGSKEHSHESFGSKGLAYDGCVILGMNFAGFGRGKAELLATSQRMQRIDFFSFCCSCTNQMLVAIHTKTEENLEFKQLLAAVERFSREVIEELAKRIVIEQKSEGGLISGDVKFHLKHKWRFRLFQSFSRLVLLALINLWFSKAYAFSGQLQDSSKGEAESFPFLNFAAEQPLLWMQNKSEPILIVSELERKKKLCYKTWMFKYKAPLKRVQFLHYCDKEVPIETNWAVQGIWDKDSPDVGITDAYYVLQDEFEQVMNHTPFSVVKLGRLKDPDALLLLLHGDESFQIKHKWRFKLLPLILEWDLYSDRLVLVTNYAQQLDISRLMILMCGMVYKSEKPTALYSLEMEYSIVVFLQIIWFSSLQTLRSRFLQRREI